MIKPPVAALLLAIALAPAFPGKAAPPSTAKTAPANAVAAKTAPAKTAPTKSSPANTAPAKSSTSTAPAKTSSAKTASTTAAPAKNSSAKNAAAKNAPKTVAKVPTAADILGFWHLERDVKSEARSPVFGAAKRLDGAEFFFTEEVPGQFIYDPLQKLSFPNNYSLNFQSAEGHNDALEIAVDAAKAGPADQSMTLEMFFKPDEEWDSPIAMKARLNEAGTEMGLEARFFEQFGQTYLHAFFTAPGAQTEHFRGGHYGTSAQIRAESPEWRHMAIVHDAEAKTLSCYIDYYQAKTIPLPGEMKWDAAPFYIGGGPLKSGFKGRIDEVRVTRAALRPAQMLRARKDPLANVSFTGVETVLPRDSGYIDVKECFGAIGDGRTDDTAAFHDALRTLSNRMPLAQHTLYIPPGTYLVSEPLESGRFFTVQGAGADKTVIKLRDKCPGFATYAEPQPVWRASITAGPRGANEVVNIDAPQNSFYDLTIDTGKGNLGAKGLEYHCNGQGRIENVHIRSGDAAGVTGLDLTHKGNGPALIKNVTVTGFDFGVTAAGHEFPITLEGVKVEGQRSAGLKNNGSILAIRKLSSANKGPAIVSEGEGAMVSLLDSTLTSVVPPKAGGKSSTAIQSAGALYALRVETPGYKEAIRTRMLTDPKSREWKNEVIAGPKVVEYFGSQVVTGHGALTGALKLPVEETPDIPWGDIHKDWANVQSFAAQKNGEDWAPAIQAAIDSGARTIYFPPARYEVAGPVHVRGKVERLFGMHSRIARARQDAAGEPVLIFDEPDAKRVVSIERLSCDYLQHASPATLVLKSSTADRFTNAEGAGKLFLEDVGGAEFRFAHPQQVWARQWNPESHADGPCIASRGATLWCLGFKTENENCKLWAEGGAQTEILGAYIHPVGTIPEDRPIFKNADSRMSVVYGTSNNDAGFALQILDSQGEDVQRIGSDRLQWAGNRARMDLFTSDGTGK